MLPTANAFTEFSFTDEEMRQAAAFTPLQLALFQTLHAKAAQRRLVIQVDPSKITEFIQQEAELKGEMGVYQYLLTLKEAQEPAADPTTEPT